MNQHYALLKYKARDCYYGKEMEFDPINLEFSRDRTTYKKSKHRVWRLKFPDDDESLTALCAHRLRFRKIKFYAVGDMKPVAVFFQYSEFIEPGRYLSSAEQRSCRVPDNHSICILSDISSIFCEYERCRDDWQTRIAIDDVMRK